LLYPVPRLARSAAERGPKGLESVVDRDDDPLPSMGIFENLPALLDGEFNTKTASVV
jgi:hypothetical protein